MFWSLISLQVPKGRLASRPAKMFPTGICYTRTDPETKWCNAMHLRPCLQSQCESSFKRLIKPLWRESRVCAYQLADLRGVKSPRRSFWWIPFSGECKKGPLPGGSAWVYLHNNISPMKKKRWLGWLLYHVLLISSAILASINSIDHQDTKKTLLRSSFGSIILRTILSFPLVQELTKNTCFIYNLYI